MTVMTKEPAPQGDSCGPDEGLDERDHPFFADPAEVTAETYPSLRNISVGFTVKGVVRALEPAPPEYVTLPLEGAYPTPGIWWQSRSGICSGSRPSSGGGTSVTMSCRLRLLRSPTRAM